MSEDDCGIMCEDCLDTMARMDDGSVDMAVTSPPYDDMKEYDGYSFDFEAVARSLARVLAQGGVLVWVVGDQTVDGSETGTSFRQALRFKDLGLNLHDTMIWHKPRTFNFGSNYCYRQGFEYMFVLSKGRPAAVHLIKDVPTVEAGRVRMGSRKHSDGSREDTTRFVTADRRKRDNVWDINVSQGGIGHPAMFPVALARDHILTWSDPGGLIYDPFMGSGTTALAAAMTGRKWLGSEISPAYCDIARRRLRAAGCCRPEAPGDAWMHATRPWADPDAKLARDDAQAARGQTALDRWRLAP